MAAIGDPFVAYCFDEAIAFRAMLDEASRLEADDVPEGTPQQARSKREPDETIQLGPVTLVGKLTGRVGEFA